MINFVAYLKCVKKEVLRLLRIDQRIKSCPQYFLRKLLQACVQRTRKKNLSSTNTLEDDFTAELAAGVDQEARWVKKGDNYSKDYMRYCLDGSEEGLVLAIRQPL
jgi:hypothetical protein